MDDSNVDYTVLRRRQQDLQREMENRGLVRVSRGNRKASPKVRRSWKLVDLAHEVERCERGSGNAETALPCRLNGGAS
jgi:hypothetical protein